MKIISITITLLAAVDAAKQISIYLEFSTQFKVIVPARQPSNQFSTTVHSNMARFIFFECERAASYRCNFSFRQSKVKRPRQGNV